MSIILQTTCGRELWAGFFGLDETGAQPECRQVVAAEVDDWDEEVEVEHDGTIRLCRSVECPRCGGLLEWPQEWEVCATVE